MKYAITIWETRLDGSGKRDLREIEFDEEKEAEDFAYMAKEDGTFYSKRVKP